MFHFTESSKEQLQNWSLMIWECAGRVWKDNFCSGGSKRLCNVFLKRKKSHGIGPLGNSVFRSSWFLYIFMHFMRRSMRRWDEVLRQWDSTRRRWGVANSNIISYPWFQLSHLWTWVEWNSHKSDSWHNNPRAGFKVGVVETCQTMISTMPAETFEIMYKWMQFETR